MDIADYYLKKVQHDEMDLEKPAKANAGHSPARIKYIINKVLICTAVTPSAERISGLRS